eukprot:SAG31_NODE_4214_length_3460_cov_2.941386_4_plen_162_part_00
MWSLTKGTNNIGELCGIGQGLMWLRDVATNEELSAPSIINAPAIILYDSRYVANIAIGWWKANANEAPVAWVRWLLAEVEATSRVVHCVRAKGHSAGGGNDAADERVQWDKGSSLDCETEVEREKATSAPQTRQLVARIYIYYGQDRQPLYTASNSRRDHT